MARKTWVQDSVTGKLVERLPRPRTAPAATAVVGDIEPFVSPVDGSVIQTRRGLRDHNRAHGVALHGDYGENNGAEYFARRARELSERRRSSTRRDREHRIESIKRALEAHHRS